MTSLPRVAGATLLLTAVALAGCLGPSPPPATEPEPVAPTAGGPASPPPTKEGSSLPPRAAFDWSPQPAIAGQRVVFEDRSTDPDDGIHGRVWEFPDGTTSPMIRVTRTFAEAGRYLVKLTVVDRAGQTNTAAREVLVALPGAGPHEELHAAPRPHVVVAVIDTGVNPYHEAFRARSAVGLPAGFLPGYPADAVPLPVTLGASYAEARKADEALWAAAEVGRLYYVPGTRIVGAISFGLGTFGNAGANKVPVLDEDGHGTATSSRVAYAAPDALLVAVETGAETLDEAIAWAAAQPWIDVVSISLGPLANVPAQWPAAKLGALELVTQAAWDAGKLVFAAAGNEPTLSATSYLSGPTWVVSVGAAVSEARADPARASKAMDIVSEWEPVCASHDSVDQTERIAGTSFSAPTAAGAAAQGLHMLRAQLGYTGGIANGKLIDAPGPGLLADGLTNQEAREALQGVARYFATADWRPAVGAPMAPAPWVQMGWGFLDGSDAAALAQAIYTGEVPAKPDEARLYMASVMAFRAAFWG